MTTTLETPEAKVEREQAADPQAVRLATAFGVGYAPVAPGTAGSLVAVALFAPFQYWITNELAQLGYVFVLVVITLAGVWSVEQALPHWGTSDPQPIVIDEVLGQWLAFMGVVLAHAMGPSSEPAGAGWIYLLIGFILFRAFDVLKPFPIRRSEKLPGAAGILMDDVLAGVYAAAGLWLLVKSGWLA
jgi:phosphatidylglycerophosphatase A